MPAAKEDDPKLETFGEGQQARACGTPTEGNPYPPDDERHAAWAAGWNAANDPQNDRTQGYSADQS